MIGITDSDLERSTQLPACFPWDLAAAPWGSSLSPSGTGAVLAQASPAAVPDPGSDKPRAWLIQEADAF